MILNSSRAGTFHTCARRWALEYYLFGGGLRPAATDDRLAIGTAVHLGLALLYTNFHPEEAAARAKESYLSAREAEWGDAVLDEWIDSAELVHRMVLEYSRRKSPKDDFSVVDVEEKFLVPLGEVCYQCGNDYPKGKLGPVCSCGAEIHYWTGTRDLLVERDGAFAILDHKTTGSTPSEDFLRGNFSRSFQLLGYVYGTEKDSGREVKLYGVNALQKAATLGKPQAATKNCTRCKNKEPKRIDCPKCSGTGRIPKDLPLDPFRRMWFPVYNADIDRFVLYALTTIQAIEREKQRFEVEPEAAFPMNDRNCKWCPMRAICWDGENALRWYSPDDAALEGLTQRETDYVDIQTEENF